MSMSGAWRRCHHRLSSPPEPSVPGRRSDTARPASHPDSFEFLPARRLRRGLLPALLCLPLLALSFPSLAPQAVAAEVQTNCPDRPTGDKRATGDQWDYELRNIYGVGCLDVMVSEVRKVSAAKASEGSSKLYAFRVTSEIAPGPRGLPHSEYFEYKVKLGGTAKQGEDYEFFRHGPSSHLPGRSNSLFDSSKSWVLQGSPPNTVTSAFIFRILDDDEVEPDETVTFTISYLKPSGGGQAEYQIGTASATFTIQDDDAPLPKVTISAGSAVTEGGSAAFTLTAIPAPTSPLSVSVTAAAAGDYGISAGTRTVTIPTAGSTTLTLATTGDATDEADGSVSVTVTDGDGYTVGSSASGTVSIQDDDEPVVSIAAGSGVTEGEAVAFTLQAVPAPASPLDVTLTVSQDGDHVTAGELGSRTVTVPTSGTVTVSVPTVDDDADELAGTVTAALEAGSGYTLGTTSSLAVEVADNDETAAPSPTVSQCVSDELMATAKRLYERNRHKPPHYAENWFSVLVAFGERTPDQWTADGRTISPMTAASARQRGWKRFGNALACLEGTGTAGTAPGVYLYAVPPSDVPEAGGSKILTVFLGRALTEGEALRVPLVFAGSATLGADYTLLPQNLAPQGVSHANLAGPGVPTLTFVGPSASTAKLFLKATADSVNEGSGETVTVGLGAIAAAGFHGAVEGDGAVSFTILEPPPEVSITAKTASTAEGADAAFTVRANRAPETDLTVKLTVSEASGSDFVAPAHEGAATVTIPKGETEAAFTVATVDDTADEPDGSVTVTLAGNGGAYTEAASPGDAASVKVADNDADPALPALSVDDATAQEKDRLMRFTVRLSKAASEPVLVLYRTRESMPVSAREGVDYFNLTTDVVFAPGETEKEVTVYVFDDSHDEGPETFELVLTGTRGGAPIIADGVAVGTIVNSDPMPAAWLTRFGRTVAEQALDGIAGRMAAPRTPGARGTVAGQAISFDPGSQSGTGPAGDGPLAPSGMAGGFDGRAGGFGPGFGGHDGRFGAGGLGHAHGFNSSGGQSRTMTMQEALLGSSFTATGAKDGAGGSLAFWGRAAQGSFDGREGAFSLDGDATTAMLGADYARGKWLVGLALMQSTGEGGYQDTGPRRDAASRALAQFCADPDKTTPEERQKVCDGAIREGDGSVEASLTAAVPYAALQASERLKLWGAAGYGTGEVTLRPQMGGSYKADIDWTMAAAGLRGDVIAPPKEGSGPALAVTSDALWARTASDKSRDLAASESDVTRLRLGLEGSYRVALEEGGHLTPKLEVGARHDGGDAETGFGVELGGGIAWVDPSLGLSLDLSGRTLIAHGNDDLEDHGFAASLAWDPAPATKRGPSLTLTQDWGSRAEGGLDALFAPNPLEERTGSGEAASRWAMEAAWGLPVLGGRFTGSPHVGFGLATAARDYTIGWRLTPEAATAPDVSFGLKATRRESDGAEPEHTAGFEATLRW